MKKLSAYLFLFLFGFSAPSFADDIRDFQIEGMSVGDSMLDFLSEEKIKDNVQDFYKSNEFIPVWIEGSYFKSTMYEKIEFNYKNGDKNYVIYNVSGLTFPKNINDCYEKQIEILNDLDEMFADVKGIQKMNIEKYTHTLDKSGKSTFTRGGLIFDSGEAITVDCNDFSNEFESKDEMYISIDTKEFTKFLNSDPY